MLKLGDIISNKYVITDHQLAIFILHCDYIDNENLYLCIRAVVDPDSRYNEAYWGPLIQVVV